MRQRIYDWLIDGRRDLRIKEGVQLAFGFIVAMLMLTAILLGGFIWG